VYHAVPSSDLSGLGFSLKPPAWLRNIFTGSTITASNKGVNVVTQPINVPLPGGGAVTSQTPVQQAAAAVENIPGGWITIAGLGVLGVLLLVRAGRK
jgi:hypothetical protein